MDKVRPIIREHTPMLKTYQWSFSIEHQLGAGMMAQGAYVGNHGTNLSFPDDPNQVPANLLRQSVANPANAQNLRPFPQFTHHRRKQLQRNLKLRRFATEL